MSDKLEFRCWDGVIFDEDARMLGRPSDLQRKKSMDETEMKTGRACEQCNAFPCDCEEKIWSYSYQWPGGDVQWRRPDTRARMAEMLTTAQVISMHPVVRGLVDRHPNLIRATPPPSRTWTEEHLAMAIFAQLHEVSSEAYRGAELPPRDTFTVPLTTDERGRLLEVTRILWEGKNGEGSKMPKERMHAEFLAKHVFGNPIPFITLTLKL